MFYHASFCKSDDQGFKETCGRRDKCKKYKKTHGNCCLTETGQSLHFLTHSKPTVPHAVKLYYFALSEDKVEEKPKSWNLSSTICNQTLKST